jgi:hypothetical protein
VKERGFVLLTVLTILPDLLTTVMVCPSGILNNDYRV